MAVTRLRAENHSPIAGRGAIVETDIPARLDRLPWGRFHTLVDAALMLGAAVVAALWAVAAERRPLEDVSRPLALEA